MTTTIPLYYGYSAGGWIMAIDAMSNQDAKQMAMKLGGRDVKFLGYLPASSFPKTTCGCITDRKQEQIRIKNAKWLEKE